MRYFVWLIAFPIILVVHLVFDIAHVMVSLIVKVFNMPTTVMENIDEIIKDNT
jgi:hypothetical protein